ncbi:hypothetical protein RhiirC2_854472 [Rhizophagus irregularis]|uniref:Uncharacterized protein n=1 Tax=Rhizophagus irregularis TaxID=588596 RepID=A0A2N1MRG2_9GLOM|nr:hypothetical protein RhiirC2_854472 [Rhizophagus irregularis]
MVFKKYKELLDFNDILAKTRLFHLEYLLNKNNSTKLNNKLTKINQISNIQDSVLLLFVRCKVYIELKMYHEAMLDLDLLYSKRYGYEYNSYIYLLREYTDFWLYLNVNNNNELSELGIVNGFSKHIYEKSQVYFISNLGLGWIEYELPKIRNNHYIQPSIEINGSINMQIDYFRHGSNREKITYIPNVCIGDLLPNFYKTCPNIPETFKDKYFSRKEMESLLELKDIINHL